MIETLIKLGLTKKEAAVYLSCMELGIASAVSIIAKKAVINRTTTYDILNNLIEKGIVILRMQDEHSYYEALPPAKLVAHLKEQSDKFNRMAKEATALLPELETHYRVSGRPKVYFYEGEEGLIRVYEETLTSTEEILAYASIQANQEAVPWYFPNYYKRRTAKGIPIRGLIPDSPAGRERYLLDKEELRRSRLLPINKLNFSTEVNFFDNKMMIADWQEKLGIIIESPEIVKVFKQTFELAWEAAEKYHNRILEDMKTN
jgi:sugar-specific transcriptional regulator TrmB